MMYEILNIWNTIHISKAAQCSDVFRSQTPKLAQKSLCTAALNTFTPVNGGCVRVWNRFLSFTETWTGLSPQVQNYKYKANVDHYWLFPLRGNRVPDFSPVPTTWTRSETGKGNKCTWEKWHCFSGVTPKHHSWERNCNLIILKLSRLPIHPSREEDKEAGNPITGAGASKMYFYDPGDGRAPDLTAAQHSPTATDTRSTGTTTGTPVSSPFPFLFRK